MVTFLRHATPHIWAGALGVVLAFIVAVGIFLVVDASEGSKANAPTVPTTSAAP